MALFPAFFTDYRHPKKTLIPKACFLLVYYRISGAKGSEENLKIIHKRAILWIRIQDVLWNREGIHPVYCLKTVEKY